MTKPKAGGFHVRLLPLSITAIVATTIIPLRLRWPSLVFLDTAIDKADVVNNLLLYMPLGIACGPRSALACAALSFGLSSFAELIQFACVTRDPSPVDVGANVMGALAGYALARAVMRVTGLRTDLVSIRKPAAIACLLVAGLSIFALAWHKTRADFSNWDPECRLAVGNELTCDRPWTGTVDAVAIYPTAVSAEQIRKWNAAGAESVAQAGKSAVPNRLFYRSQEPSAGSRCPIEQLSPENNELLLRNLQRTGEITIAAWITPNSTSQKGPARIVTFSRDEYHRNFTLGQIGRGLTFRLRTPGTGYNGTSPALFTPPLLRSGRQTFVAVTYDGYASKAFVNGKRVAEANLGARRPRFPKMVVSRLPGPLPLDALEVNICEIVIGCLAGIGSIGIFRVSVPDKQQMWLRALAVSALCGALVWLFCVSEARLGLRVLMLSLFGGAAAAWSSLGERSDYFTSSNTAEGRGV